MCSKIHLITVTTPTDVTREVTREICGLDYIWRDVLEAFGLIPDAGIETVLVGYTGQHWQRVTKTCFPITSSTCVLHRTTHLSTMFSRIRTLGVDDLHRVASLLPGTSAQWIAGVTQPPQHAPSIPQKPMRPLADWPPELVFEVMKNLDEVSLLELGATCKQVNALFFAFYSQREGIKIDQHGNVNVCNNTSARHKLRAVRLSLQSSKITHLSVILKPRFDQLESDMAELCRVLRYTTRLREITVHIGSVKRFIDSSGGLDGWMTTTLNALPTFNLTSLVRRYADLADAAESAGCHRMSLDGGDGICNLAMGLCNQRMMREFKVCKCTLLASRWLKSLD